MFGIRKSSKAVSRKIVCMCVFFFAMHSSCKIAYDRQKAHYLFKEKVVRRKLNGNVLIIAASTVSMCFKGARETEPRERMREKECE